MTCYDAYAYTWQATTPPEKSEKTVEKENATPICKQKGRMTDAPLPPPTSRPIPGYTYDAKQQADKDHYLKQLARDFPSVNVLWREWVYDFCANTPQGELDRLMETGELDNRESKFSNRKMETLCKEWNKSFQHGISSSTQVLT